VSESLLSGPIFRIDLVRKCVGGTRSDTHKANMVSLLQKNQYTTCNYWILSIGVRIISPLNKSPIIRKIIFIGHASAH